MAEHNTFWVGADITHHHQHDRRDGFEMKQAQAERVAQPQSPRDLITIAHTSQHYFVHGPPWMAPSTATQLIDAITHVSITSYLNSFGNGILGQPHLELDDRRLQSLGRRREVSARRIKPTVFIVVERNVFDEQPRHERRQR